MRIQTLHTRLIIIALLLMAGAWLTIAQERADPLTTILVPEVISERPHDTDAFTQGLLLYDGYFYESTGLRGESSLRKVDPETGEVVQQIDLDDIYFGEGLARVDDRLIQLTWTSEVAFIYDLETFEQIGEYEYEGQGWGLCYDGEELYMSNGSNIITVRDPVTFEVLREIEIELNNQPIDKLNELECVDKKVYANVWQTVAILEIDKKSGLVTAAINATDLHTPEIIEDLNRGSVLNGIAYDPENEVFYLTGKRWPVIYETTLVPFEIEE